MTKCFVFSKKVVIDLLVVVWAASLSFIILSQGASELDYYGFIYPVLFLPVLALVFVKVKLIKTVQKNISLILLFAFIASGLLSSAYHSDIAMVFSLYSFALFLLVGLYVYPSLFNKRRQLIVFNTLFFFSLGYFLFFSLERGLII